MHINIKDLDVVGDGTTDDTAAIQNAIDSIPVSTGGTSPGHVIVFPNGKYKISSTLVVGNRRITFWSASVMGSGSAVIINMVTANTAFFDFTTGNADVIAFHGIEFIGASGCTALKLGSSGQACYDSRITNCWFSSIGTAAILGTNLQGCHITNCAFDSGNEYGIKLDEGSNNIISNNRFYGCTKAGVHLEHGSQNVIANNILDYCGSTNDTTGAIHITYAGTETRANSITGNMFRANQNDIVLNGQSGVYGSNTGVNDTVISGNTSDRCFRHFLYATDAHHVRVTANSICVPSGSSGFNAIDILGTCDGTYLAGNSIGNASAVYGLNVASTATNTVVGGNQWKGSTAPTNGSFTYDYEQSGTWTPSIGGTATYSVQEGHYLKVGRLVYLQAKLVINAIGTGSQSTISGLPFTCKNASFASSGGGTVEYCNGLASNVVMISPAVINNSATMQFNTLAAAGATMTSGANVMTSGTRIDFSICYHA